MRGGLTPSGAQQVGQDLSGSVPTFPGDVEIPGDTEQVQQHSLCPALLGQSPQQTPALALTQPLGHVPAPSPAREPPPALPLPLSPSHIPLIGAGQQRQYFPLSPIYFTC